MKKVVVFALAVLVATAAFAQPRGGFQRNGGRLDTGRPEHDKLKAEQVAFITDQVGLTPEEAQVFWPVYNKVEDRQTELRKAEREAYGALNQALEEGSADVSALLDNYIKAKKANEDLHLKAAADYKKVLPADKVARFYLSREQFRRNQIGRLAGDKKGHREGRPDGFRKPDRDGKPGK